MLTIIVGLPSSGKTTWVRNWKLQQPAVWFAEVRGWEYNGDVIWERPDFYKLVEADMRYKTIVIDHQLRIKNIQSITTRERIVEMMEKSDKNWIMIAHTLKGIIDLNIWSMRWGSGFIETADFVLGLEKGSETVRIVHILKQRYMVFDKNIYYYLYMPDYFPTLSSKKFDKKLGGY